MSPPLTEDFSWVFFLSDRENVLSRPIEGALLPFPRRISGYDTDLDINKSLKMCSGPGSINRTHIISI